MLYPSFVTEHNMDDYDRWFAGVTGTEYTDPNAGLGGYGTRTGHHPECCCETCDPTPEPTHAEVLADGQVLALFSPGYCDTDHAALAASPF